LTLLLDESAAAAIREDVIDIRFESGRFSDRDAADDEEDAFDSDDLWEGVRAWSRVADEEADIAVMAVVLDHLLVLLGDKDEVAVHVPKPSWKN
jgi:hypothetical protein